MIKVESITDTRTGVTKFAFECSSAADHETLDKLRVAFLGDHPKQGGYVNSNRLIVEAKFPIVTAS